MTKLTWDYLDYDVGVDRGVFYPHGGAAEAWNGLVSVNENVVDLKTRVAYREGRKVTNQLSEASYSASIIAYTYPPSFFVSPRTPFGFSYRTKAAKGYKIHLVYNALAHFPGRAYGQDDASPFSIDITTVPQLITNLRPTAHIVINGEIAYPPVIAAFESVLYGDDSVDGHLPFLDEIINIFEQNSMYKIIDNGDGTFTMDAPDDAFLWLSDTEFMINWPKVITVDDETIELRTW